MVGLKWRCECNLCGTKSGIIDDLYAQTAKEAQMLAEFKAEHARCAENVQGWLPEMAVTPRPLDWQPQQVGAFGSPKAEPQSVPKPHGHGEYTGPYGEIQHVDVITCCHCRRGVEVRVGTLGGGGFCALCYNGTANSGWTCGRVVCQLHVPYEVQLDNADAGRPLLTPRPAMAMGGAVLLTPKEKPDGLIETA